MKGNRKRLRNRRENAKIASSLKRKKSRLGKRSQVSRKSRR